MHFFSIWSLDEGYSLTTVFELFFAKYNTNSKYRCVDYFTCQYHIFFVVQF